MRHAPQVVSVVVAFALSAVQARALEHDSDDDEEVRRPLGFKDRCVPCT